MDSKLLFLNKYIEKAENIKRPITLFKYRSFDAFTFDMLENEYVYLCQANQLDDPSECLTTINIENYVDIKLDILRRPCVEEILKMIKPYASDDNYAIIQNEIYRIMGQDFKIKNHFLIDFAPKLQQLCPSINTAPIINWLATIPKIFDDPQIKPQIEELLYRGFKAREDTGICSLSKSQSIKKMWEIYANDYSGYCIEYDMSNYQFKNYLFPVVYKDNKETNFVIQLVASIVGQMIQQSSYNQIDADKSQFLQLFLTKETKWAYQKEWRIIGNANDKVKAPNIKRIILGKRVSEENKKAMKRICKTKNIKVDVLNYSS